LYNKLALVLGGLLIAIGLVYIVISQSLTQHHMARAEQLFNRSLAGNLVADQHLVADGRIDQSALKETFDRYMTINPSIELYLLDLQGNIVGYSADPGAVKRNSVSLAPIEAFLQPDSRLPILGDDPRSHDQRKSFSVTALPSGYLYVVLRGENYDFFERLQQDSLLLRLSAWILGASLLFALVVGLLSFALLTRRLRRLARLMDDFRRSNFKTYTLYNGHTSSGDEIDQLGEHFDQMAHRMRTLLTELHNRDHLRRELISNVSHDLRTPLTSLHGYLETLKFKSAQLTPLQREDYLDAALGHSQRLSKLIEELFELAKLDARIVQPRWEPFAPAELLQDIVQKFQLQAQQRDIRLEVSFPEQVPFVEADIGLIERVLENLISNALHHTPAHGRIVVDLSHNGERTTVSVTDNGHGIAAEDLPYVFERFFRGSDQARNDGNHVGLGLAIARRIVELHRSDLKVASQPDQGTRFSFQLPVYNT
jgi:signal transduction histidine kinase